MIGPVNYTTLDKARDIAILIGSLFWLPLVAGVGVIAVHIVVAALYGS